MANVTGLPLEYELALRFNLALMLAEPTGKAGKTGMLAKHTEEAWAAIEKNNQPPPSIRLDPMFGRNNRGTYHGHGFGRGRYRLR